MQIKLSELNILSLPTACSAFAIKIGPLWQGWLMHMQNSSCSITFHTLELTAGYLWVELELTWDVLQK